MYEYTIARKGTDFSWDNVEKVEMIHELHPRHKHDVQAWFQVCYDDEAIYVKLTAKESDIRAEHQGPLGEICEDSCLEFFLCPIEGDERYFNIECNPNGVLYHGFGTNVKNLQRLIPETPSILPVVNRTEDGWTTEYAIPYTLIRMFFPAFSPAPGKSVKVNCYKCGDLTAKPHWLCWCKVPEFPSTFHCPAHFGTMYFA